MEIGISTACLYPMYIEKSINILHDAGFENFEVFFNSFSELERPFLDILKGCGKIVSVHPFTSGFEGVLFFSEHYRRFTDSVKEYCKYFEAASYLGAKIVVLHGQKDYARSPLSDNEYFERYEIIYKKAKEYGIMLAQENVNTCRSEKPEFIKRMREYLNDECAFVFDIKQSVRAGVDPFDMCKAMGQRIVHVHASDNSTKSDCMLPGTGTFDFKKLKTTLSGTGCETDMIIELYSRNFTDVSELCSAHKYLIDTFS